MKSSKIKLPVNKQNYIMKSWHLYFSHMFVNEVLKIIFENKRK